MLRLLLSNIQQYCLATKHQLRSIPKLSPWENITLYFTGTSQHQAILSPSTKQQLHSVPRSFLRKTWRFIFCRTSRANQYEALLQPKKAAVFSGKEAAATQHAKHLSLKKCGEADDYSSQPPFGWLGAVSFHSHRPEVTAAEVQLRQAH